MDPTEFRAKTPDTHGFRADERFEYARSSHTAGYGPQGDRTVQHRRRVLFVKPDYWLVVDDVAAKDDREHTADTLWTLKAPGAEVDAVTRQVLSRSAGPQGARLQILPFRASMADSVRVAQGEREPEVIGWLPRGFEQLTEAPTAIHHAAFRGKLLAAYALAPFTGEQPPIARVEGDGPAFTLGFADGRQDRFEVTPEALRAEVGGARFEAVETPVG
ncbi:MAG: heparinase II/III family protein [Armatimonadetes bacterium]|nr:heparinase II/III family protein [Armatimonadota bacterium]